MKKLPKETEAIRADLIRRLGEIAHRVETSISQANNAIQEHTETIHDDVQAYNDLLTEVRELQESSSESIRDYIGERSDAWQEGEKGQAYEAWAEALDSLDFADIDVETPPTIDVPEFGAAEILEQEWISEPDLP